MRLSLCIVLSRALCRQWLQPSPATVKEALVYQTLSVHFKQLNHYFYRSRVIGKRCKAGIRILHALLGLLLTCTQMDSQFVTEMDMPDVFGLPGHSATFPLQVLETSDSKPSTRSSTIAPASDSLAASSISKASGRHDQYSRHGRGAFRDDRALSCRSTMIRHYHADQR